MDQETRPEPSRVLVFNAGSSSLKFSVYCQPEKGAWHLEARGQIAGVGAAPTLTVRNFRGESLADRKMVGNETAPNFVVDWIHSRYGSGSVRGVGHRVVHGGMQFPQPTILTREVLSKLYELVPLAPLHQPHNLAPVEAVFERLPDVPQVACFDTSFHQTQSPIVQLIPLPEELRNAGLRRYGFHGLSYEYIASILPDVAPEIAGTRVVAAHLGSGASLCALKEGKSVDSTLGFSALDGLCMGTRPGSLDPGVLLYLLQELRIPASEVEEILYRKSGLLGVSGISNDMRELLDRPEKEARLAVDYFVYRATREIGAMTAVLGGLDALVFTAGIGENSAEIRRRICEASAWLGVKLEEEANRKGGPRISSPDSKISAWVIPANEELMIARHTISLLGFS